MARIDNLTKSELLAVLEHTPQRFWPPRPTRQDKSVLVEAIRNAHYGHEAVRAALARAWRKKK